MDDAELERFVAGQRWRFASTMPQWPHWYCLRKDVADQADFESFVAHILSAGYEAEFRPEKREAWELRRYLDFGEFHYWTMDQSVATATLVNRALHPNVAVRHRHSAK